LVGIAAMLLPIAQRSERDAESLGKLDLRHVKRPANTLCRRNAGDPSKTVLAVLDRQGLGIGPSLGEHLIIRFGAKPSPQLGRHPVRVLIDRRSATAGLLRCSRFAHGLLPSGRWYAVSGKRRKPWSPRERRQPRYPGSRISPAARAHAGYHLGR
jgi:hypothetical protein